LKVTFFWSESLSGFQEMKVRKSSIAFLIKIIEQGKDRVGAEKKT
jgi:hypothetical protein